MEEEKKAEIFVQRCFELESKISPLLIGYSDMEIAAVLTTLAAHCIVLQDSRERALEQFTKGLNTMIKKYD